MSISLMSVWNFISLLRWCHVYLILCDLYILILVSAHLSKRSPLPDFTDSLQHGKSFTSQLSLGYWVGQQVESMGRQGLLSGSLVGQD